MLREAGVPALDTRPGDLRVSLSEPPIEPVAKLPVRLGVGPGPGAPVEAEFRVLAASHQVIVGAAQPAAPRGRHVETVACGLVSGEPLRDGETYRKGMWRLTARVERTDAGGLASVAAAWVQWATVEPSTVTVRFTGNPYALTALALRADGWVAVHLYPDHPGDPGTPGLAGDPGMRGLAGDRGAPADAGNPADPAMRGLAGDRGVPADAGAPGDPGVRGLAGDPGLPGAVASHRGVGPDGLGGGTVVTTRTVLDVGGLAGMAALASRPEPTR